MGFGHDGVRGSVSVLLFTFDVFVFQVSVSLAQGSGFMVIRL